MSPSNHEKLLGPSPALPGRMLAIDFGLRRVGLAISDPMQMIASGLETLHYKSRKELVNRLIRLIQDKGIVKVVIGLPRHMDGSEGEMAKAALELMDELSKALSIPFVAWDERLSTVQAQRTLRESGVAHHSAKRDLVDRLAAVLILQSYLDSMEKTRQA